MQLTLERVTKKVGAQTWLYEQSIEPRSGAVTVLHAPWKKLANEKPKGQTVDYNKLLTAWKEGRVR